ncbi:hypothetical protein C5L14_16675 [Labrys okinawensis]|uniref:Uncharacterized protein n=1 Tax=Labrys okinawensis TaxID=346911 RepID=A0A2S9QC80_9HYPH|nr:hypothetical protein [Labrys okinawensis]PRH86920.1 hypothetical protein C5L14_16675 [Labrys okinawensis]
MSDEILKFDFSSFHRMADRLGVAAKQLPYALSRALNESAFASRSAIIQEWPSHVKAKNPAFIGWALGVEKSNKHNLRVAITDARSQGRGHLFLHATGGTKSSRGRLAIPSLNVRRGRTGVVSGQRPKNLRRSFRRGDVVYAVTGRGKRKKLKLMYTLKTGAQIKKDMPFFEIFRETMTREMQQRAPKAMLEAMKTAIRK